MTNTLWHIESDLEALIDTGDIVDDAQRAEYEQELIAAHMAAIDKRDRVGAFLSHCDAQVAAIEAEVARLTDLKRRYQGASGRVESMVLNVILARGADGRGKLPALEGKLSRFSARACPPSVEILDPDEIPMGFAREIPPTPARMEPDKAAIRKALTNGETVPGAALAPKKYRLDRK